MSTRLVAGVLAMLAGLAGTPPALAQFIPPQGACPAVGLCRANNFQATGTSLFDGLMSGAGLIARFATPGPIGNTTPSSGAFTTLAASGAATLNGTITGTGVAPLFASPPAIGGTAAAAGTFTGLTVTTNGITATAATNQTVTTGGAGNFWRVCNIAGGLGCSFTATTAAQTILGTNGNTFDVANIITAAFYRSPGSTYTLSGVLDIPAFWIQANYTGPSTALPTPGLARLVVPADTVQGTFSYLTVSGNMLTGATGSRIGINNNLSIITSPITGDTSSQQYQPIYNQFQASQNVGGTNTSAGAKGSAYGEGNQVVLRSGATNFALANGGGEDDLAVQTGGSARDLIMRSFVLLASHAVPGARANYGLVMGMQQGAVNTIDHGLTLGYLDSPFAMATTAAFIDTEPQVNCGNLARACFLPGQFMTYGARLEYVNYTAATGFSHLAPGFSVDGTGQTTLAGSLVFTSNSTGVSIDIPNDFKVTSVAVATAGTSAGAGLDSYYPLDLVYGTGAPKGQYQVTHTKVISAVSQTGGTGGTNGACLINTQTGTGTPATISGTVTGGALTGALTISVAGDFTVNPNGVGKAAGGAINTESLIGCSFPAGTRPTVSLGMGVLTVVTLVGDVYSACPGAGGITPTKGSGTGLTLTPTCATRDGITVAAAGTKLALYGATPIVKATPVGACAGNTGCQALRDALGNLGAIATGSISN